MHEPVNLAHRLSSISEYWSPEVIGSVNDDKLHVVKVLGDFEWHSHADSDECFLVLNGQVTIELRDGAVALSAGEVFVVRRALEHRPRAAEECQLLVITTSPAAPHLREQARQRLQNDR
jgi:mannose-6-phosphate isomerase-like protein (cupin superfamily)